MVHPWADDEGSAALAAEVDDYGPDSVVIGDEFSEVVNEEELGTAASGITSHVFTRSGSRATSKSTFKPPHTTDAVYTRVAFYTADTARLVLSAWKNKGPANPYQTLTQVWYFDDPRARKALVLWFMNGTTWRSWAS